MKKWVIRDKVSENLEEQLLRYRNIKLMPDYDSDLPDPFLMPGMDKAVERILAAIKNNEKIVIFGDYDADGVCASAIFHEFFKKIDFQNFHVHIPDRHLDGYGMTADSIDEFSKLGAKLIITLDCGVTDYDEVERANKAGIDVVIIDHHLPPEKLPNAVAIVNSEDLCGAGTAFKVIRAIIIKGGFNITYAWEKWLLDLAAIATIADMVALTGENRTLVFYGLQVLKKTKRAGLISLCQRLRINLRNISEDDIAFMVAPRINVASRMGHANTSFELLTTGSVEESNWISERIETMTKDRKVFVEKILQEIDERIDKTSVLPVIVVGNLDWNAGVLGLTATRVVEKYNRPAFLWGKGERAKDIKASCRSNGSINLVELMKFLPADIISDFGGHAMAGGFSVREEKIGDLEKEILSAWEKVPKKEVDGEILYIDKEIGLNDINSNLYGIIEKFAPFGVGNPKPVFLLSDIEIKNIKKFGNGGIHLQLDFGNISAIGFFIANAEKYDLKIGQKIDLAATLEKSFFRPVPELRLRIVDIR